jgi:lysyl-tRNA synthetase class 2
MLERLRAFFFARGVLEVETPQLSVAATPDPNLASLSCRYTGPGHAGGQTRYLHTSPEFPMKRLLAAGSDSIYQVCKVFRDGESGRLHNPEFTMLEWYRTGLDERRLMDEVEELVCLLLAGHVAIEASERLSYREAFERYAGLDPHRATAAEFAQVARARGVHAPDGFADQRNASLWRDLLLTHLVEPQLGQHRPVFVYDYPAAQAALARVRAGDPPLASRFELFIRGMEIANGFHELTDGVEQRARFGRQQHARLATGQPAVPLDEHFLAALAAGLPDCAGVALGFDRLVMLAAGKNRIDEVLAFAWESA